MVVEFMGYADRMDRWMDGLTCGSVSKQSIHFPQLSMNSGTSSEMVLKGSIGQLVEIVRCHRRDLGVIGVG